MREGQQEAVALAAERLRAAAADENVYMSLARATRIAAPVLEAVTPLLLSHETIERARAADQDAAAGKPVAPQALPLTAADQVALRAERFNQALRRIERAAMLHDLSDVDMHSLPPELRTVMAAYADCHLHLRKAASLLKGIVAQHGPSPAQRTPAVQLWEVETPRPYPLRGAAARVSDPVA